MELIRNAQHCHVVTQDQRSKTLQVDFSNATSQMILVIQASGGNREKNPIAIGQGQRFEKREWSDCLHIWIQEEWLEGSLENAVGQVKAHAAHMCGRDMPLKEELQVHMESMFVWKHLVYTISIASLLPLPLLSPCHHISSLLYSGVRTQGLCCSICITVITVVMCIFSEMLWLDWGII